MTTHREFDYPDRYEREKVTRIMPDNLRQLGFYTLRMMWHPDDRPPFASEFLTCIIEAEKNRTGYYDVAIVIKPKDEAEAIDTVFNDNGYMVVEPHVNEMEMGYFVGSLDPTDVEFGELVASAEEKLAAR